jgi:apolipoprotein N-acyltransferase
MKRSTAVIGATVGFALLYVGSTIALGQPPDANDSGATVVRWFTTHGSNVRTWAWLLTLAAPLFALYAAFVRAHLPAGLRDLFLIGAIAFLAETAVQTWIGLALSWHGGGLAPATARTLLDVADYWGPVLTSTTIMMLTPVVLAAFGDDTRLPRWLGILAAVAVAEQLVETLTIFGQHGFMAPGGPMNVVLGAVLVAVTLVALGFVVARLERRTLTPPD